MSIQQASAKKPAHDKAKDLVISPAENGGWALNERNTELFSGPAKFIGAFTTAHDLISFLSRALGCEDKCPPTDEDFERLSCDPCEYVAMTDKEMTEYRNKMDALAMQAAGPNDTTTVEYEYDSHGRVVKQTTRTSRR